MIDQIGDAARTRRRVLADCPSDLVAAPVELRIGPVFAVAADGGALPQPVTTTTLDGPNADAVGLIPTAISSLPRELWGAGLTREIAALRDDVRGLRDALARSPGGKAA